MFNSNINTNISGVKKTGLNFESDKGAFDKAMNNFWAPLNKFVESDKNIFAGNIEKEIEQLNFLTEEFNKSTGGSSGKGLNITA